MMSNRATRACERERPLLVSLAFELNFADCGEAIKAKSKTVRLCLRCSNRPETSKGSKRALHEKPQRPAKLKSSDNKDAKVDYKGKSTIRRGGGFFFFLESNFFKAIDLQREMLSNASVATPSRRRSFISSMSLSAAPW